MKQPDWQVPELHTLWPPPQGLPSETRVQAVVELEGAQAWQSLAGSIWPAGYAVPPMTQPPPPEPLEPDEAPLLPDAAEPVEPVEPVEPEPVEVVELAELALPAVELEVVAPPVVALAVALAEA